MSNGAEIQDSLLAALGKRPEVLVVDMTPTTFCDSAGVRAIMLTHRQAAAARCELRLVIASPGVSRVFSIIGAGQLVQIHSELPSALDAVPGSQHDGSAPSHDGSGPLQDGSGPVSAGEPWACRGPHPSMPFSLASRVDVPSTRQPSSRTIRSIVFQFLVVARTPIAASMTRPGCPG